MSDIYVKRNGAAWALATILALVGCGSPPAHRGADPSAPAGLDASTVCPSGSVRDGVIVCRDLQPRGDPLSMPADSEMVKYGAVARGGARFLTRDGAFELASSITNTLQAGRGAAGSGSGGDSGAADDGDVAARTGAYAQLVYRAQVNGMTVEKLTPIIRIDESALMTHIFGGKVLEGTIAARNGPDEYATSTTLPVRIELARVATDAVVTGHIVNARRPVRLSTGRCSAALSATGTRDPLRAPFTDTVKLQRFPSMHAPFDDEMLLKWNTDASNMGTQFYPSAATLLGLDPLKRTWETMLHGNPLSGPAMTLRMVQGGGGGAC